MQISIRPAKPEDFKIVQKLNHEVFQDNAQYDEDIIVDWPLSEAGEAYFKEICSDSKQCCLIAEVDGQPAGYVTGSEKEFDYRKSRYVELNNMGVSPEFRSHGLGARLVEEFKRWAKEHGYERIYVTAYFKNEKAVKFYERCGFEKADTSLEMVI